MTSINTSNGIYSYEELHFENGLKRIDLEISKENLLNFKSIADANGLTFGLIYGTLLGAVREKNFIEHDEDTDVFILSEDVSVLLDILFKLKQSGFIVGRYTDKLLSLVRNGEYIDVYFFKKYGFSKRISEGYVIKSLYLENLEKYEFLGVEFNVPKDPESVLIHLYGKDWRTPKENTPASNYSLYLSIKFYIKNKSTTLFKVLSRVKRKI